MSEDSKFLAVGIFVIASLNLMVTIWLWFMYSNIKQYNIYQTTFKESIDGITTNSIVKYNGPFKSTGFLIRNFTASFDKPEIVSANFTVLSTSL
jgi:hypothetical protein